MNFCSATGFISVSTTCFTCWISSSSQRPKPSNCFMVQSPRRYAHGFALRFAISSIIDARFEQPQGDGVPIPLRWQWKIDRVRERVGGWFRSDPGNARPQMCPSCGTLVGVNATKCHQCGANLRFGLAAASRSVGGLIPANAPVTYTMLSLCCLMYGISMLYSLRMGVSLVPEGGGIGAILNIGGLPIRTIVVLGCSVPLPYELAEPWRLITAVFLHGSLIHILFNMWVLMDIGPMVEDIYGSSRYLFFYILTGAIGYVPSSILGHVSVGAS